MQGEVKYSSGPWVLVYALHSFSQAIEYLRAFFGQT